MTPITKHFSLEEFACHDGSVYPMKWLDRLRLLCAALETVREQFDKPITILSGYRTLAYNTKIGGARASQHMEGRASDIVIAGIAPLAVHNKILQLYQDEKLFIGGLGQYPTFTHMDVRPGSRLARWSGSRTEN